jgi:predicted alpha-1,6-mannanase (GH76 family)
MKHLILALLATLSATFCAVAQIADSNILRISSCYVPGKSLSTENSSLNEGAYAVTWAETGVPAQRWVVSDAGAGLFYLANAYSGIPLAKTTTSTSAVNGSLVQKSDNPNYRKWKFIPVQNAAYPNAYYISPSALHSSGDYLYLELADTTDGKQVKLQRKRSAADSLRQMWTITAGSVMPSRVTPSLRDSVMRGWKNRYFNILKTSTGFWGEAEMMETILDAYETSGKQEYKAMFEEVYERFVGYPAGWGQPGNGQDWRWNDYNDDIAWATLASVRAYLMFGKHPKSSISYLTIAKNNFNWMYARALLPSGMLRWCEAPAGNYGSNSCINGPAEVAACYLAIATGDDSYYEKAKNLYALQRQHLYDPATGKVFDCGSWSNGSFTVENYWVSTYNQGTFLGAALMLYNRYGAEQYKSDAHKIVECTRKDLCDAHGVVKVCGNNDNDDLQGFKGILMRYLRRYVVDLGLPSSVAWLQQNALHAYNNRNSQGVTWTAWWEKTPESFDGKTFGASTAVSAAFNAPLSSHPIVKDASKAIEAEHFDYLKGVFVERSSDTAAVVANIYDGYFTAYSHVDFGGGQAAFAAFLVQGGGQGRKIEIRLDSLSGALIGAADVPATGQSEWVTTDCPITDSIAGRHSIYLLYKNPSDSSGFKVDNFRFLKERTAQRSSLAALSDLTVSAGVLQPAFNPDTLSYTVEAPTGTGSITLTAQAAHAGTAAGDLGAQQLVRDTSVFSIAVTAEDGATTVIYTVTVARREAAATAIMTVAKSALRIYPNPVANSEALKVENGALRAGDKIKIYSFSGALVATCEVVAGSETVINISHLPQGVYLVKAGGNVVKLSVY